MPPPAGVAGLVVSEQVTAQEWDAFVESHPDATGDHLSGWKTVIEEVFRHRCAYLAARRNHKIVGVLPLVLFRSRIFGRFAVSMPFLNYGGVAASDPDIVAALVAHGERLTRDFRGSHLELRHQARQLPDRPCRDHKVALTMRLPDSSAELWTTIDRKARNQVRKAQKEGLSAVCGGGELVDEFYGVFAENMRDLGTPVYPRRLFAEVAKQFPSRVHVFVVRYNGRAAAGAVAFRFRDTLLVPWASSRRSLRQLAPNMLLYWTMLEHAVGQGCRVFDFGRSSRNAGTSHFKSQWGAVEASLFWEYVLVRRQTAPDQGPANARFSLAIEAWKRLPVRVANTLGPAIVRNIP